MCFEVWVLQVEPAVDGDWIPSAGEAGHRQGETVFLFEIFTAASECPDTNTKACGDVG